MSFFCAKTIEAFNRLPEEFTAEDVMRCFGLTQNNAARARVFRLLKDGLVEKVDEFVENGTTKAKYKKTGAVMIWCWLRAGLRPCQRSYTVTLLRRYIRKNQIKLIIN